MTKDQKETRDTTFSNNIKYLQVNLTKPRKDFHDKNLPW